MNCPAVEDLPALLELTLEDPGRLHLEECPRCRARLKTYQEFIDPSRMPLGARVAEAESRLSAALEKEIFSSQEAVSEGRVSQPAIRTQSPIRAESPIPAQAPIRAQTPVRTQGTHRSRLWWWITGGGTISPRAVLAAGATLALVATLVTWKQIDQGPRPGAVLRGDDPSTTEFLLQAPVLLEDGAILLRWSPVPEAETYEVRLYSTDLTEIGRVRPESQTQATVRREDLPASVAPGSLLLWRVIALRMDQELRVSDPKTLRVP